ncbi:MAG: hypothetical protein KBC64_06750 [Simkaniaceae bacterium]|nr:hypothetical protein [Simkaniaceae bacterium]
MRVESLSAFKKYLSFIGAKEFQYVDATKGEFLVSKTEEISNWVLLPLERPLDFVCKNFNQPFFIATLNVVAVAAVTIAFYPDRSFQTIQSVCAPFFHLEPWMMKLGAYLGSETMISALMVRTFSRLNRAELIDAWENKQIIPIHLGYDT